MKSRRTRLNGRRLARICARYGRPFAVVPYRVARRGKPQALARGMGHLLGPEE